MGTLSSLANDPKARAELTRFLEPQRRLFADWAAMMQKGAAPTNATTAQQGASRHDSSQHAQAPNPTATAARPTEISRGDEHGGDSLRVAQLALRVAELEKRLAQLESSADKSARAPSRNSARFILISRPI